MARQPCAQDVLEPHPEVHRVVVTGPRHICRKMNCLLPAQPIADLRYRARSGCRRPTRSREMQHSGLHRRESHVLCRRQAVVHFGLVSTPIRAVGTRGAVQVPVIWAIGSPEHGQLEELGVWQVHSALDIPWPQVLDGLWAKGVERIGLATTSCVADPVLAEVKGRPRVDRWRGADLRALALSGNPGRRGRPVSEADQFARHVQASLARSVRRHGPFDNEGAAVDHVATRLERFEFDGAFGR